jgi:hypothetical protein
MIAVVHLVKTCAPSGLLFPPNKNKRLVRLSLCQVFLGQLCLVVEERSQGRQEVHCAIHLKFGYIFVVFIGIGASTVAADQIYLLLLTKTSLWQTEAPYYGPLSVLLYLLVLSLVVSFDCLSKESMLT